MDPLARLERIFDIATRFSVEVETHPVNTDEFKFLMSGDLMRLAKRIGIARGYSFA